MASFKVRRAIRFTGGGRIGSNASYTDFNTDGDITQSSASTALSQATIGGTSSYTTFNTDGDITQTSASTALSQATVGGASNYTTFDTAGRQTMTGTAKVYRDIWLPAQVWYGIEPDQFANPFNATATTAGSTPTVRPYGMNFGKAAGSTVQVPVMSASAATNVDARMATSFIAPADAATSGSVEVKLYFTTKVEMETAGSMEVYRLNYDYLGTGGSGGLVGSGSILYGGSMSTVGNGLLEVWDLGDIASFNASSSPFVVLQLTLEQSNACCMAGSPEDQIFGLKLRYVADSLGITT